MATTISTQDIVDVKRDIDDIGKSVNEKVIVSPRYGEDFKSLPMIAADAQATIGEWETAIALITQEGGVPALAVSDASGKTQQEVNDAQKETNRKGVGNYDPLISYVEDSLVIKDGLLQKLTGGVWRPKNPTYYDFGAKIDGVTDDTAAFIAYHTQFKHARLPQGRMLLSSIDLDLLIVGQSLGITIEGEGTAQSYLDFTGSTGFYSGTNKFFRDFNLRNLELKKVSSDKTGVGVYIGSGGAEQINFESVTYRGWLIGRSTNTWNSSFKNEVFRVCKYPFAAYGTSTNVSNPYAIQCTSPYMFGYQSTLEGVLSIPSIPYAYSLLSGFAADDCGADGSIYKFGRVSGITLMACSAERAQGTHIFDLEELTASSFSSLNAFDFSMYVSSANPNLLGLILKPSTALKVAKFTDMRISLDKAIYVVSGDGSGVELENPYMNNSGNARYTELPPLGFKLNGIALGGDGRTSSEVGVSLTVDSVGYARVKYKRGKALLNANTQKLSIFAGSLSEGLGAGLMFTAEINAFPIRKSGGSNSEKTGKLLVSCAMDYNAPDVTNFLKVVRLGELTTLTTVSRNMENTTALQFDIEFEVSNSATRHMIDIDLTYNGTSNSNGIAWAVQSK